MIVEIVMKTFCNYCRKATETKDGDCVDCKLSKTPNQVQKKDAYKLCWNCNKRFRGNQKYEARTKHGDLVFAHKRCVDEIESDGAEDYPSRDC